MTDTRETNSRRKWKHGDDTGFGFTIPTRWPRWKMRCQAHKRKQGVQCGNWAVRGMPTCRFHGSGGSHNAKIGLIRYLAWVTCGVPRDTPIHYARFVAIAAALNQMFNEGKGTDDQRLRAALWLMEAAEAPEELGGPQVGEEKISALDVREVLEGVDSAQEGAQDVSQS